MLVLYGSHLNREKNKKKSAGVLPLYTVDEGWKAGTQELGDVDVRLGAGLPMQIHWMD